MFFDVYTISVLSPDCRCRPGRFDTRGGDDGAERVRGLRRSEPRTGLSVGHGRARGYQEVSARLLRLLRADCAAMRLCILISNTHQWPMS